MEPEDYGKAEVEAAAEMFNKFLEALSRYDCDSSYTAKTAYAWWNCDDCRKAYAAWLCSQYLVKCTPQPDNRELPNPDGIASCHQVRPCISVCNNVVRKCPVSIGFTCPDYYKDYEDNDGFCNTMAIGGTARNFGYMSWLPIVAFAVAVHLTYSGS